jgi:hypothetical protein
MKFKCSLPSHRETQQPDPLAANHQHNIFYPTVSSLRKKVHSSAILNQITEGKNKHLQKYSTGQL